MNYQWIIVIALVVVGIVFLSRFRKTKLFSNFPFEDGEEVVFTEEPALLQHKQSSIVGAKTQRNYHVLMRPIVKVTNKGKIIFAQKYKNDALVYAVFSLKNLADEQKNAWKNLGYTFATLSGQDIKATASTKKAAYEITFIGGNSDPVTATMGVNDFIMQIYTNDISSYEKNLGVKNPVH